jgi:hypothetical protein
MTIPEIIAIHPAPWRQMLHSQMGQPGGVIKVVDAAGKEVMLMTLLDYVMQTTAVLFAQESAAKAQAV